MDGLPGNWAEPDGRLLDQLTRHGALSAVETAIGFTGTPHQKTTACIRAALRALLANRLITAAPLEEWPEYVMLDPPAGVRK